MSLLSRIDQVPHPQVVWKTVAISENQAHGQNCERPLMSQRQAPTIKKIRTAGAVHLC